MQDPPSPAFILDLVIAQLGAQTPSDPARSKFEQRVATAALQLVRRAIAIGPESDAAEQVRLAALLGQGGGLEGLNRILCARIREGTMTLSTPGLAAHLRATALEKLAVDQPTYAAYRRVLETSGD